MRKTNHEISNDQLLAETKLAYASWIKEAGYGQSEWDLFNFQLKSDCPDSNDSIAAVVLLEKDKDSTDSHYSRYTEPRINCSKRGYSYSCSGAAGVVGLGRWGSASHSYNPRNGKWIKIHGFSQIRATFSPYVDWFSLEKELKISTSISEKQKSDLLEEYRSVVNDSSFDKLTKFAYSLEKAKLISASDSKFNELFKEFQRSGGSNLNEAYTSSMGLYHVLLHEVGHNFGMMHSHEKRDSDSIYVETPGLRIEENGKEKFVSAMAYSDNYLYLTRDDKEGIKSMRKTIDEYLDSNFNTIQELL